MKTLIVAAIILFAAGGCDWGNRFTVGSDRLSATFTLTDTTGEPAQAIHEGEDVLFRFTLVNRTGRRLSFYRGSSAPDVIFEIRQGERRVASSVDGYAFLMIVSTGYLNAGDTLRGFWRGPNTPARAEKIMLELGSYEARVHYPDFVEADVRPVLPIGFTVEPYRVQR